MRTTGPTMRVQMVEKIGRLLFDKTLRYKVTHGGRVGTKSVANADYVLYRMLADGVDVVVCRELKDSIYESVHKLLWSRVEHYGLAGCFEKTNTTIDCKHTGAHLCYKHLHDNVTEIKGLEDITIAWIFEAQNLQKESWDVLQPTISRTKGSEFLIEFNPDGEDDFVWQNFIVNPPPLTGVVHITYLENPWCSEEAKQDAEQCLKRDPEGYRNIWLGEPSNVGARIYPMFDEAVHVRNFDMEKIRPFANFFCGQDPATVYWPFLVWGARIRKGADEFDYWIYNEFPTVPMMDNRMFFEIRGTLPCSLSLKKRATMFRVLDRTLNMSYNWIEMRARGIDTRFAKASGAASLTVGTEGMIQSMADPKNGGMAWETPPEHMIDTQRDRIRQLLEYNEDLGVIPGLNEPHFYVAPHCRNVIDALKHHRTSRKTKGEDEKRKDSIDALRIMFALMEEYPHKDPAMFGEAPKLPTEPDVAQELREMYMNRR